jgi:hypothetical protein
MGQWCIVGEVEDLLGLQVGESYRDVLLLWDMCMPLVGCLDIHLLKYTICKVLDMTHCWYDLSQ